MSKASALLAALFGASLLIKAGLMKAEPRQDESRYAAAVARSLAQSGFSVRIEMQGSPRVLGWRGGCRLKARNLDPHGTARESFERLAEGIGPLRYGYRGGWYRDPPKLRPLFAYYVQREFARLGLYFPRSAILALAASPGCEAPEAALSRTQIYLGDGKG